MVPSEAEIAFTIFATVGAEAGVIANDTSTGIEEDFQQESATMAMDSTEVYDSSKDLAEDLDSSPFDNSEDFELDLSEADGPDSENWNIGATLTEDLSEVEIIAPEEPMNDADFGTGEFEVQGLGFDLDTDLDPTEDANEGSDASADSEFSVFAEETAAPEMEPYAEQNEIAFELPEDDSEPQVEVETTAPGLSDQDTTAQVESLEMNDLSVQDPEPGSDIEMSEISLETELKLDDEESEAEQEFIIPLGLNDPETDENPTLELEGLQMNLETDQMVIEPIQADSSSDSEVSEEDPQLKMDTVDDEIHLSLPDEESTPDE